MRILNEKYEEITEAAIDLSKGRLHVTTIIRPEVTPVDNITKFAYADEDYETVQVYERMPEEALIAELKQNLTDTDYVVIKIAEGVATAREYAEILAKRQMWREEIKDMEGR